MSSITAKVQLVNEHILEEIADSFSTQLEGVRLVASLKLKNGASIFEQQLRTNKGIVDVAYATMVKWREDQGDGAMVKNLLKVLRKMKRLDLMDQFKLQYCERGGI